MSTAALQARPKSSSRYHFFVGAASDIDFDRIIRESLETCPDADFILVTDNDSERANILLTDAALNNITDMEGDIILEGWLHQPQSPGWNNLSIGKFNIPGLIKILKQSREPRPRRRIRTTVTVI